MRPSPSLSSTSPISACETVKQPSLRPSTPQPRDDVLADISGPDGRRWRAPARCHCSRRARSADRAAMLADIDVVGAIGARGRGVGRGLIGKALKPSGVLRIRPEPMRDEIGRDGAALQVDEVETPRARRLRESASAMRSCKGIASRCLSSAARPRARRPDEGFAAVASAGRARRTAGARAECARICRREIMVGVTSRPQFSENLDFAAIPAPYGRHECARHPCLPLFALEIKEHDICAGPR